MMKKFLILTFLISSLIKAHPVMYNQEFQVNTYIRSNQSRPAICGLSEGGFVVVWESWNQDGDDWGIFGQFYDSSGTKYGQEFQINSTSTAGQTWPTVCSLSAGRFVVCWESWNQDGDDLGIFGQMYDRGGEKYGSEFQVNTYINDSQAQPKVCHIADGRFVVIWESRRQDGDWWGIYGQLYNGDGTKYGQEFRVNTYTVDGQYWPSVCALSDSRFLVCWASFGQDGDGLGIFGQIFNKDGIKINEEFQVNSYTTDGQFRPNVCAISDGGFVVCWDSWYQDGDESGIFGQIYDSLDTIRSQEFQINTYITGNQSSPTVCGLSD
jgi:hypothetical protein